MSGHNKWSTIKHKKAAADAKRGQVFSKIAREIVLAVRQGGADAAANANLRQILQKARSVNMPSDNVERAIKKGAGEGDDGVQYEEIVYEGYAPGGIAIVVAVLTDNRNRTAAEVRHAFSKNGGNMAQSGAVMHAFQRKGQIFVERADAAEETLLESVLEAGAEDMQIDGDAYEVLTDPGSFMAVVDALNAAGIPMREAEVTLLADTTVPVADRSQAAQILRFIEALEDLDDVQNVYTNADFDDAVMAELESD
jgi:YebC/PmpR family DNA-binding regulatory protein